MLTFSGGHKALPYIVRSISVGVGFIPARYCEKQIKYVIVKIARWLSQK